MVLKRCLWIRKVFLTGFFKKDTREGAIGQGKTLSG
jgi:hypothetical protein